MAALDVTTWEGSLHFKFYVQLGTPGGGANLKEIHNFWSISRQFEWQIISTEPFHLGLECKL